MRQIRLHENYIFYKRVETADDGYGNILSDWVEQFRARGERRYDKGGESVIAARLQGVQPVKIIIRTSASSALVCEDWKVVDANSGTSYNIMAKTELPRRQYFELLCKSGGNDG